MSEAVVDGFTIIPLPSGNFPFGAKVVGPRVDSNGYCFGSEESANSAVESTLNRQDAKDAAKAYLKWHEHYSAQPDADEGDSVIVAGLGQFTVTPEPCDDFPDAARVALKDDDSGEAWVFYNVADAYDAAACWADPIGVAAAKAYLEEYEIPTTPPVTHDPVERPWYYNIGKIQVLDFILDQRLTFGLGSAVKYVCRAGHKDPSKKVEDLRKAIRSIEAEIDFELAKEKEDEKW